MTSSEETYVTDIVLEFATEFPIGTQFTTEEFADWSEDNNILREIYPSTPYPKNIKSQDYKTFPLKLINKIKKRATSKQFVEEGYKPFWVQCVAPNLGLWEVMETPDAIADINPQEKALRTILSENKKIVRLVSITDLDQYPPAAQQAIRAKLERNEDDEYELQFKARRVFKRNSEILELLGINSQQLEDKSSDNDI